MSKEQMTKIGMMAIAGLVAAAATDFDAFKKFQSFKDLARYDWGLASFRWFKGAILGIVTAAGWMGVAP